MQSPTPMSQYDFDPEWLGWLDDVLARREPYPPVEACPTPTAIYEPPKRPPKPRAPRKRAAPQPPSAKVNKRQHERPPPTPNKPFDFDDALRRLAAIHAAQQALLNCILGASPTVRVPEPYRILGLTYPCSPDQLKARWRGLAFRHHPDRGGDLGEFIKLKTAYEEAQRIQHGLPMVFRYPG